MSGVLDGKWRLLDSMTVVTGLGLMASKIESKTSGKDLAATVDFG